MREAAVTRKTRETDISLTLRIEGTGQTDIDSGCGFLDHMLTLLAAHGRFDLTLRCAGDTKVDYHHSVEDIGIALGQAFAKALGDCRGITRYGSFLLPMDEALVLCALDISGRGVLVCELGALTEKVGDFDTELVREFMLALCRKMGLTLHLRRLSGENTHHIIEAAYKALGRALKAACAIDPAAAEEIPSTKGRLTE